MARLLNTVTGTLKKAAPSVGAGGAVAGLLAQKMATGFVRGTGFLGLGEPGSVMHDWVAPLVGAALGGAAVGVAGRAVLKGTRASDFVRGAGYGASAGAILSYGAALRLPGFTGFGMIVAEETGMLVAETSGSRVQVGQGSSGFAALEAMVDGDDVRVSSGSFAGTF